MKANRFGWTFGSRIRRGFLSSLLSLSLLSAVAQAAPVPYQSNPAANAEAAARTNRLIDKYNAQQRSSSAVESTEKIEQVVASLQAANTADDVRAIAPRFGAALAGPGSFLVGEPTLVMPDAGTSTIPCVLAVVQSGAPRNMRVGYVVSCPDRRTDLTFHSSLTGYVLETYDRVDVYSHDGEGDYTLRNWKLQEVDHYNYDATHEYAYIGDYRSQLTAPHETPEQSVIKILNKKGFPYPEVYDSNTRRYVPFPSYPFNPDRSDEVDYGEFGRLCQEYYQAHGWTWYRYGRSNHHVKPVRWGGADEGDNCFRLPNNLHTPFTTWWGPGNRNFETPVSH